MSPFCRTSPYSCTSPCIPPIFPLFSCTASLYSLAPFIPDCSVANRRVARAASDWLANSARPAPARAILSFWFWFSRTGARVRPSKPGSDWRAHFSALRSDWPDSWCSDRRLLLGRSGIGEKGYMLLYSCTHNNRKTLAYMEKIRQGGMRNKVYDSGKSSHKGMSLLVVATCSILLTSPCLFQL